MQITEDERRAIVAYLGPIATGDSCEPIVRQIPPALLESVWPHVVDKIAGVVERSDGRWTIEDIAGRLLQQQWQLWVVWDGTWRAVLATELCREASGLQVARIVFTTGSGADRWTHLIADIETWAKDQGASKLEMMARKGWARRLPEYKMSHVLLEKDLSHGQ